MENEGSRAEGEREIVITRFFEAPRELVFDAWTDTRTIGRWWRPRGFSTTTEQMEVRPGGIWRFTMHAPDGTAFPNRIEYLEIVRQERLAYAHGDGTREHFRVTVNFATERSGTRLISRMVFPSREARDEVVDFGAIEGGDQTLERLAEHLAGKPAPR